MVMTGGESTGTNLLPIANSPCMLHPLSCVTYHSKLVSPLLQKSTHNSESLRKNSRCTGATGTCIDANVTDSADDGPLISYNAPFNPHASIMNNADLLLNVASNHSDGACTRLHPEGEDSASLSEAGDDDNADDDFLRKLYKYAATFSLYVQTARSPVFCLG